MEWSKWMKKKATTKKQKEWDKFQIILLGNKRIRNKTKFFGAIKVESAFLFTYLRCYSENLNGQLVSPQE